MRVSSRFKVLLLAGVGLLLLGISGCDPGTVVFRGTDTPMAPAEGAAK
jgi:hypothetical protein